LIVKAGLNLGDVDQFPNIDVTIDGADEVDVSRLATRQPKGGPANGLKKRG